MLICRWEEHLTIHNGFTLFGIHGTGYPLHGHDGYHEWMIVLDGHLQHQWNGQSVDLKKGEILWIRETDFHELKPGTYVLYNLPFMQNWVERFSLSEPITKIILEWKHSHQPIILAPKQEDWAIILTELQELIRCLDSNNIKAHLLFVQFCFRMLGLYSSKMNTSVPESIDLPRLPGWLKNVLRQIESPSWLAKGEGVKELARESGVSLAHFSRTFRAWVGCSPVNYLQKKRLEMAAIWLKYGDASVKEIAARVGIMDEAYFYRLFRRYYQMGTKEYRNRFMIGRRLSGQQF